MRQNSKYKKSKVEKVFDPPIAGMGILPSQKSNSIRVQTIVGFSVSTTVSYAMGYRIRHS